jgi:predicted porin
MRNSFVGLAGGWGTFLVGRHDTPLKISTGKLDLFSDTMADYNGTVGFQDLRADNAIAYISPSFSGFQFAGAVVPTGGGTATGVYNEDADSLAEAYSLAGIYKNGPFYASVAYESLGDNLFAAEVTDPVTEITSVVTPGDDDNKWRIGLGLLDWNGFTLTGIYEDRSNVGGVDDLDQQLWQIQAAYAFGNNTIKGMYGSADRDGNDYEVLGYEFDIDGDKNTWAIGFDHNFSKRTKAYVLYTDVDDDEAVFGDSWSGFSMGMIHSF